MSARGRRSRAMRGLAAVVVALTAVLGMVFAGTSARAQSGHTHEGHDDAQPGGAHVHAPVPSDYRATHVPASAWTHPQLLARGKEIYTTRCAVCHGDSGDGKGPAGLALPLKPPDLRDVRMMSEMAGNYSFWRISEGGAVEPFRSMGSTMPAWKDQLSIEDRWAVIVYQHTFSGHDGPHVTSEHPELVAGHTAHPAPAAGATPAQPDGSHKH